MQHLFVDVLGQIRTEKYRFDRGWTCHWMYRNTGPETSASGKVTAEKDSGVSNCYQFTIQHEDHTLGNLLTQHLLAEDHVLFAGYRIHHPLDDWIYVRVNVSETIKSPEDLVSGTIERLQSDIDRLQTAFKNEIDRMKTKRAGQDGGYKRY